MNKESYLRVFDIMQVIGGIPKAGCLISTTVKLLQISRNTKASVYQQYVKCGENWENCGSNQQLMFEINEDSFV